MIINIHGAFDCELDLNYYCKRMSVKGDPKPVDQAQVEICKNFIERFCGKRKAGYGTKSSYSFKHLVESKTGEYIANGSLIQAFHDMGYRMVTVNGGPNCRIGYKMGRAERFVLKKMPRVSKVYGE